jgi:superoxide reductase
MKKNVYTKREIKFCKPSDYVERLPQGTEEGFQIYYLKPGMKPEATFKTTEKVIAAFEYCNLHGLWKAEV